MSSEVCIRKVGRCGTFSLMGKTFAVKKRGFEMDRVTVHYDSRWGTVQKIGNSRNGESEAYALQNGKVLERRKSDEQSCT